MAKPLVASYCTTFLKPEMLHIYRQISGLKSFETFVITRQRQSEDRFPMPVNSVYELKNIRVNFLQRAWSKYVLQYKPIFYRGEFAALTNVLNEKRPQLMHVYFGHTGVHLLPFIKTWRHPVVVSFHGMDVQPRLNKPDYLDRLRSMFQAIPLALVRSQSLRERLIDLGCDPRKIRLNRTGIPLDQFAFKARQIPADGHWRLVQACRLIEKKGLDDTLHAFANFAKVFPRAHLTIAGDGPLLENLTKLAVELGLEKNVRFAGFLSSKELCQLYHDSHLFIHPSRLTEDMNQEGVPNSMLEAMSTGLPIVATLHGGIPEAVTHGRNGLLSAERDQKTLTEHLFQITRDAATYQRLSRGASQDVRENFEQEQQISNLESIYVEAISLWQAQHHRDASAGFQRRE